MGIDHVYEFGLIQPRFIVGKEDMTNSPPVVFLVDDDPSVLKALGRLLTIKGFEARPFSTPGAFLRAHDPTVPGCILLDVAMPERTGLELQKLLTSAQPIQPVIFISGNSDIPTSVSAMKEGAFDFLTKPVAGKTLLAAIRKAIAKDAETRRRRSAQDRMKALVSALTKRERDVFDLVVTGKLNKQIAGTLGIAEKTVKVHRARMMSKMGVRTLAELVQVAERIGAIVHDGPDRD